MLAAEPGPASFVNRMDGARSSAINLADGEVCIHALHSFVFVELSLILLCSEGYIYMPCKILADLFSKKGFRHAE